MRALSAYMRVMRRICSATRHLSRALHALRHAAYAQLRGGSSGAVFHACCVAVV